MKTFSNVIDVTLHWYPIKGEDDPRWDYDLALYAYIAPEGQILYIGKCDRTTVRKRWCYSSKSGAWDSINEVCDTSAVVVAEIKTDARLTRELLADIESLLIHQVQQIQPLHNVQNIRSRGRHSRPGMRVKCRGAWPLDEKIFVDTPR